MSKLWPTSWRCVGLILCVSLSGCATAVFDEARSQYYAGDPVAGVALLDQAVQEDKIPERDSLLVFLERGLMLHRAGLYEESAKAFVQASAYIDQNQKISISEQSKSLLANDWSKTYFGEYSEQLLTHSYAMMSFIMAGKPEAAAVEARQALQVLDEHGDALQADTFSRALIALSFELAGQYNDAYVAYRALHELLPNDNAFAYAAYRAAQKVASTDGEANYRERIPKELWQRYESSGAEAILLLSEGRGPRKASSSMYYLNGRVSFPVYVAPGRTIARLTLSDESAHTLPIQRVSTDIYTVSSAALAERGKSVLAKAALRVGVKHELVSNLRDNNQAAGEVLNVLFFLLEEADTRSWQSLPARLSLVRVALAPGQKVLKVKLGGDERVLSVDASQTKTPQVFSLHF